MNTYSHLLDELSSQSVDLVAVEQAVQPDGDQSRDREVLASPPDEPWPGVTPPAGWFLKAPRITVAPDGARAPREPVRETGPGHETSVPGPAAPYPGLAQHKPPQQQPLVLSAPVLQSLRKQAPVLSAPVQQAPAQQAPVASAPVQQAPVQQAPVLQVPVQQPPIQRPSVAGRTNGTQPVSNSKASAYVSLLTPSFSMSV